MAITLEQAKLGYADKVDAQVVDSFRRASTLMDSLVFDNAVSPSIGGSTLVYGYIQLQSPSTASFRTINSEYTASSAVRALKTANLKIFGGSSQVDRVIQDTSSLIDEIEFQLAQQVKAAVNLFHYSVINGDTDNDDDEFDGLDVLLTGSSTEYNTTTAISLDTSTNLDSNYKSFLDMLDEFISEFDGEPNLILGNSKLLSKIRACARRAGYLTNSEDAFGRVVSGYNGIPLVDMGQYYNGSTTTPNIAINSTAGTTDLYAICTGLDGFHGVSPLGDKLIRTYLPDLSAPGAVKNVEVEMVAATVLKNSRKAGVFRKIKVQ